MSSFELHRDTLREGENRFQLTIPAVPFHVGAYSLGISAHAEDQTPILPVRRLGVLLVNFPPVAMAGKSDAGIFRLPCEWEIQATKSLDQVRCQ